VIDFFGAFVPFATKKLVNLSFQGFLIEFLLAQPVKILYRNRPFTLEYLPYLFALLL
jgi:hypothetical protein